MANNPRLNSASPGASQSESSDETVQEDKTAVANSAQKKRRTHRPGAITRLLNRWFDRVMGLVKGGGHSDQAEEYAAHRTTRDYIWNTAGAASWGVVFPIVTMVATQLVGTEQAGMISMAFTVGILLMFVGNFGVRTYQVSDITETHSFNDYQLNRVLTCILMMFVGILYCAFRGYGSEMFTISMGVFAYKMIDGLADVYEGRLQQVDKLYLAGISQTIRSVTSLVIFSIVLLITRSAVASCIAMAIAAAVTFVVVTYPLALLESPHSKKLSMQSIVLLFRCTFPLFIGIFLFNIIDSMPKFVMEGAFPYDNQLYYNALYFPAQAVFLIAQFVYKPLLVRMAGVWQDESKHRQFTLIMVGIMLIIVGITVVSTLIMAWIGVPLLNLLYGVDFSEFYGLMLIFVVAGGIVGASDFLYQVVTIMRRQRDVMALYCVTFGLSIFISILLISFTGLYGAVLSFLIVMSILLVLLVWEYIRIRIDLSKNSAVAFRGAHVANDSAQSDGALERPVFKIEDPAEDATEEEEAEQNQEPTLWERQARPSEVRAERLHREEVIERRTHKHKS